MFVQVKLVVSKNAPITVVPAKAVYTVAGLSKIFVINGSAAREIRFTPGQSVDDWLEVPGNLVQPGDTIAIDKLPMLTEGTEVRIESGPPAPARKGD
jgi:multidrug efflux pump subunit AcrA (membrane-fusion protein)